MATTQQSFGDFLARVARHDGAGLRERYGVVKAAMTADSGSLGGYLVPQPLLDGLMGDVAEEAVVRPLASVVTMTADTLKLPTPDASTPQSAGVAPYFGGLTLAWTPDDDDRAQSEPAFRQTELKAHDLSGYALVSNPLLDDAQGLDRHLRKVFARAVAYYEDYAFLRGTGLGQPLGVINAPGAVAITRATGNRFQHADAKEMVRALLPSSWTRAIWALHPLALEDLTDLSNAGGDAVWHANQPRQPGSPGPVGWLHNMPAYVSSALPALGTAGDVVLFDPTLYAVGDRGLEVAVSRDEPTAFLKNQTVYRVLARRAGAPLIPGAVRMPDASTSTSPYVVLT